MVAAVGLGDTRTSPATRSSTRTSRDVYFMQNNTHNHNMLSHTVWAARGARVGVHPAGDKDQTTEDTIDQSVIDGGSGQNDVTSRNQC